MSSKQVRPLAVSILKDVLLSGHSLSRHFPYTGNDIKDQERALLQALCFGVCRWYHQLKPIVDQLLKKPFRAKDKDIEILILLGLFQLAHQSIPEHAAVNETVAACKPLKKEWAKGVINALLRAFLDDKEALLLKHELAHPSWLTGLFKKAWPEDWQSICAVNNTQAPMTLRVNLQKTSRENYLEQLTETGINAKACACAPEGIQLNTPVTIEQLPGFKAGLVSVQDEATQLSAGLMDLGPGQRVLDACAAPGGKSCHILEAEPQLEQLVAVELDKERAARIDDNLQRLELKADVTLADACDTKTWWDGQAFDRILLDAPCSATGVIRRHPDIKLLRAYEDIAELASTQLEILSNIWPLLKPGGLLIYATCSILPQENESVLAAFFDTCENVESVPIAAEWGQALTYGRQLLPQANGHDGFYYARLTKTHPEV